jgi:NarL family two-component system response regulator LiaR
LAQEITVLIVDDHFVVRRGIEALLFDTPGIEVVGEAADGAEAVRLACELEPEVVLMDLLMPYMDGVEAIHKILAKRPGIRILVLTGTTIDRKILDAVRAGAAGYLSKASAREKYLEAIRRVHRGEPSLPMDLTRKLFAAGDFFDDSKAGVLTERETEILSLVATGLSNQGVADRIHIAEVTVRTHVSHILRKLKLSNRVEATLYALREGLVTLED